MTWDPDCYHKFQSERFAPFEDLLKLIRIREGLSVIDLGCGTGELTRRLADALPQSNVVGIDTSAEMLGRAAEQARPGLRFEQDSIQSIEGRWDIVFSHAALHWIDDHTSLVPRLLSLVKPDGQLAVQLPSNHAHATQTLLAEVAGEEPFRAALDGWMRASPVLSISAYAELLHARGGKELSVFEKVYPHVLEDSDALADWISGTTILPYLDRLPEALRAPFAEKYRERLRLQWPQGPVFYPFRRILFAASL